MEIGDHGKNRTESAGIEVKRCLFLVTAVLMAIATLIWLPILGELPASGATTTSGTRPLVTAQAARSVAIQMFSEWQSGLQSGDARLLEHVETGIQLDWDTYNCTTTTYIAHTESAASPLQGLDVIVPKQYSYPVRVLAEAQTSEDGSDFTNGTSGATPALELIVLTKATASASWKISFVTSVYSTTSQPPPFLPASTTSDGLAGQVTAKVQRDAVALPAKLADYWDTWKERGAQPTDSAFLPGPFTTSLGAALATEPDGVVGNDLRQSVTYSSHPSVDGAFVFPVGFGEFTTNPTPGDIGYGGTSGILVCSAIQVSISFTPQYDGSPLFQDRDETSFGPGLAPGFYSKILDKSVHESCVLTDGDHLSVLGADGNVYAQHGVPAPSGERGTTTKKTVVSDLLP